MLKRTVLIGEYNTAAHGWTLTAGWKLSDPEQKTNYIEKSGGDGTWDLSTALTDGLPRYRDRSLTATLECSEGTREDRERLIAEMVNRLDGLEWRIVLPDHPEHYLTGRVHVAVNYNDPAHAAVTITATCAPWLYKKEETILTLETHSAAEQTATITNSGRLAVVPELIVEGSLILEYGTAWIDLSDGTYEWPMLLLTPGDHVVKYSATTGADGTGSGKVVIKYREAVLR